MASFGYAFIFLSCIAFLALTVIWHPPARNAADVAAPPQRICETKQDRDPLWGFPIDFWHRLQDIAQELPEEQRPLTASEVNWLLQQITPFLNAPFRAPLKVLARPKPLTYDCKAPRYSHVLTGEPCKTNVTVWSVHPFGTEYDLLEIRLFELDDVVDFHVISESTLSQRGLPKPLYFPLAEDRYARFRSKILHVVIDDVEGMSVRTTNSTTGIENIGEPNTGVVLDIRSKRLMTLQEKFAIKPDDIIVYGDLDEIPSAELLLHMKHCQLKQPNFHLNVNSPMFNHRIGCLFRTDHPPGSDWQYSLRFPQLISGSQLSTLKTLSRIEAPSTVGFGLHLTWYMYPPQIITKMFLMADGAASTTQLRCALGMTPEEWTQELLWPQDRTSTCVPWFGEWSARCLTEDHYPPQYKEPGVIWWPWVVTENRERYPEFFLQRPLRKAV